MAKQSYLPTQDDKLVPWLNAFALKFETHATTLGYTAADVKRVKDDAALFQWLMALVDTFTDEKEERVNFKNLLRNGPQGVPVSPLPDMPVLPDPPLVEMLPGIVPRTRLLVKNIKSNKKYTASMGTDMGIIGADDVFDPGTMKPKLKLSVSAAGVKVQWEKGNADAIRIEKAIGTGAFSFLAIDTEPDYIDTTVLPAAAATWKYKAVYLISDKIVGQWSGVESISVGA